MYWLETYINETYINETCLNMIGVCSGFVYISNGKDVIMIKIESKIGLCLYIHGF